MADAATVNHNLVLPEVGASKDSWGTKINQNLTKLDTLLKVGLGTFVNRAGDTMTGLLTLPTTNPTAGTHAAHKSYVDGAITSAVNSRVPNTRKLVGGSGIETVIGDLSADRTIAVDATVVRTTGNQSLSGTKTFTSTVAIDALARLSMAHATGPTKELYYSGTVLGIYDRTNLRWDLQVDANGNLTPRGTMDAAKLSGTLNNASLSGDYSFANLDLSGRLFVSGSDNWGSLAGVRIDGASPNIYFRQTDATPNAMIGINTSSFYVVGDMDGDGVFDVTALQLALDGSSLRIGGALMAEAGRSISAGSGLSGGGDLTASRTISLGTPSSVTGTSGNTLTTTSHTHSLDLGNLPIRAASGDSEPRLLYINGTGSSTLSRIAPNELQAAFGLVPAGRYVSAGSGLSGGGDFTANRTIAMGTPSSITSTSTNSTTSTSHTHSLGAAAVRELMAEHSAGQVGTYALLCYDGNSTNRAANFTTAGSNLNYANSDGSYLNSPSGTWQLMGHIGTVNNAHQTSLWLRIS